VKIIISLIFITIILLYYYTVKILKIQVKYIKTDSFILKTFPSEIMQNTQKKFPPEYLPAGDSFLSLLISFKSD